MKSNPKEEEKLQPRIAKALPHNGCPSLKQGIAIFSGGQEMQSWLKFAKTQDGQNGPIVGPC